VRPPRRSPWGAVCAALVIASLAGARTATLRERAHLRSGPSSTTDLLGDLPAGTSMEVLGESAGWIQVETAEGQSGYVWGAHLGDDAAGAAPKAPEAPATSPTRTLADEVHGLRDDVNALRERPAPATAADLDQLRAQLDRLASAHQDLVRQLEEHQTRTPAVPPEGPLGVTLTLLILGIGIGLVLSRLLQGRRGSRQRDRLRF
jgi:uncharacterized protein YgiM (DUF1202 family)